MAAFYIDKKTLFESFQDQRPHFKSFLFERTDLMPLANYLELWHFELLETSPRLASIVSRDKELFLTSASADAFTTFSPLDLMTPLFNGETTKSDILEDTHLQQLFANLPPKIQNQPWTLSYSTQVNGFSLRNLYRSVSGSGIDDSAVLRWGGYILRRWPKIFFLITLMILISTVLR